MTLYLTAARKGFEKLKLVSVNSNLVVASIISLEMACSLPLRGRDEELDLQFSVERQSCLHTEFCLRKDWRKEM